jgi:hypothetical protein
MAVLVINFRTLFLNIYCMTGEEGKIRQLRQTVSGLRLEVDASCLRSRSVAFRSKKNVNRVRH